MARFDLHRSEGQPGYLLNVQDALLDELPTRIVIPVLPADGPLPPFRDLSPQLDIDGVRHTVFVQYLAAVPRRELGRAIGNLEAHRDAITKALDVLLTGF